MPTLPAAFANQSLGRAFRLDVSTDHFSSVDYRYGSVAGALDGSNQYDARLAKVGRLSRGLGNDRIAASSSVDVLLDNTDSGADWLLDVDNWADVTSARFRLYVVLFDSDGAVQATWQLGEFVCGDMPRRDAAGVQLHLVDDVLGPLSQPAVLPTLRAWKDDPGSTTTNCPFKSQGELRFYEGANLDMMVPLAFGDDWVQVQPIARTTSPSSTWKGMLAIPVCASKDDFANTTQWRLVNRNVGTTFDVPSEFKVKVTAPEYSNSHQTYTAGVSYIVWSPEVSNAIDIDGETYFIHYIKVDLYLLGLAFQTTGADVANSSLFDGIDPLKGATWRATGFNARYDEVGGGILNAADIYARGVLMSTARAGAAGDYVEHGAQVLEDLVSNYTKGLTVANLDTASIARVVKAAPNSMASGVVASVSDVSDDATASRTQTMRSIVTALAQSCDFDVFTTWDGKVSVSCDFIDYDTYTTIAAFPAVFEVDIDSVEDFIPGEGERGAPYNRVYLRGGKTSPAEKRGKPYQGPYDEFTLLGTWGRVVSRVLEQGWRSYQRQGENPFFSRGLDTRVRPRVRFRTDMATGFRLELGAFFLFNWSRGGAGAVYEDAVFQCERLDFNPDDGSVSVEAIWKDDLREKAYLLDNEAFLVRVTSGGGRTVTVTDSSNFAVFSSGNLTSDGVAAGDMLLLKDSTQTANVQTRYRALRVQAVADPTTLALLTDDSLGLDFDAPGGVAVTDWEIRRGHFTYPSDLTNYADGNDMYGRVSDVDDEYSNNEAANPIQNG